MPMTSSHMKKLVVTEMKMCRWACGHMLRDHLRNENIKDRLKVESITEEQESKTELVWPRKEMRPRLRRKKDSGDGTTWEKKARKTEAELDGLCQRDMRAIGTTKNDVHDITGWRRIVCLPQRPHNQVGAARRRRDEEV